jgi:hypothetical protein
MQSHNCTAVDFFTLINLQTQISMKQNPQKERKEVRLKPYSITELSDFFECSLKTLKTWLDNYEEEIGPRIGHYYTPKQVKIIIEKVGVTGEVIHLKGRPEIKSPESVS